MPSDNLHTLYSRLQDTINRTVDAFDSMDVTALTAMLHEHRHILSAIKEKGDCQEAGLLKTMEKINRQVKLLGEKIREKRDDICGQLMMAERKRQAMAVYTNDNRGQQPNRQPLPAHREFSTGNVQ